MPFSDASIVRQPRLVVLANGVPMAAPLSADVVSNNHHAADTFRLTAALPTPGDAAMWADTADIAIDIRVALDGASPVSLIQGFADLVDLDAVTGRLQVEGRDNAALLIEARTQETFANRTSSEIATLLAGRHGLSADVTATTTPVGRFWQIDHDRITLDQFSRVTTEWDLLTTLAGHESFDLWVSGSTLHFHPSAALAPNPLPAAVLRPAASLAGPANVSALRLERSLVLAGAITVTVKSWQSRQQSLVVASATNSGSGAAQNYVYVVPNLTADAAQRMAQARLAELTSHERVAIADMPGELVLTPRLPVAVAGTGTAFDQVYWIDEIVRSLHWQSGFTQRVRARNSTVSAGS